MNGRLGLVSIVGAGPGDPELMTLKAMRLLQQCDLVLYDALVSPEILAMASSAHRFFVGKRAGRKSIRQETIHRLMIRAARQGKNVVRLKCGDPFVFGRGGEEGLALAAAGIPFEIVPGLTSAIAGPASAGIPVTHRGLTSGFAVISGHSAQAWKPIVDSLAPGSLTLVVLMGLSAKQSIARHLMARGWSAQTPCAVLLSATTPQATHWMGTLADLGTAAHVTEPQEAPGTLVIGEVVALASTLGTSPLLLSTISGATHGSRG